MSYTPEIDIGQLADLRTLVVEMAQERIIAVAGTTLAFHDALDRLTQPRETTRPLDALDAGLALAAITHMPIGGAQPRETVALTTAEQATMHRALRRSVTMLNKNVCDQIPETLDETVKATSPKLCYVICIDKEMQTKLAGREIVTVHMHDGIIVNLIGTGPTQSIPAEADAAEIAKFAEQQWWNGRKCGMEVLCQAISRRLDGKGLPVTIYDPPPDAPLDVLFERIDALVAMAEKQPSPSVPAELIGRARALDHDNKGGPQWGEMRALVRDLVAIGDKL